MNSRLITHDTVLPWKQYIDVLAAFLFAGVTTLAVPFSLSSLITAIHGSLLCTLFCLMAVIAAFRQGGMLTYGYSRVFTHAVSVRALSGFFVFTCFFMSMGITNDVALLIFVPLAISVLQAVKKEKYLIYVVTLQTIAANLGSMLTPIGNPQNLFLYSLYQMTLGDFLYTMGPVTISSAVLLALGLRLLPTDLVTVPAVAQPTMTHKEQLLFGAFFLACIVSVLRLFSPWYVCICLLPVLLRYRSVLRAVDYKLLFLFVFLFIGVGNLGKLPMMQETPAYMVQGHEFWAGIVLSQILSNVPATVMLSPYCTDSAALLLGVNIGGLGTMIASMASIISFKAYSNTTDSQPLKYVAVFTAMNVLFLGLLIGIRQVVY